MLNLSLPWSTATALEIEAGRDDGDGARRNRYTRQILKLGKGQARNIPWHGLRRLSFYYFTFTGEGSVMTP